MRRSLAAAAALLLFASPLAAAPARERVDLLVRNGTVITMDPVRRVIAGGAVAVRGGAIVAVGPEAEIAAGYRARQTLDAGGGLVLPGLVNAHGHAPMSLFRGVADDQRLMDWLQKFIFPAEAKNVTAAFVRAGTRLAALEMIRSGTTTFADMYYFEDEVARATKEAGLRGVLGETLIEFPAPDNKTMPEALAYTEAFLKRWQGDPLIVPAVAPHSVYLAKPETLRAARALADRFGAPLLIHVSETMDEQAQVQREHGKTPVRHLADLGFLRKGVVMAHGVWLSAADRTIARQAEAGVVHCPQSNMKLASGAAPVKEMLAERMRLGLGTDGAASNNDLDMFEEMLTAALLAKQTSNDPTVAPAAAVLEMATLGGARALGLEDRIGSLEPGKRADLIVVGFDEARAWPVHDPVSHLVYTAKGADVRHSVIEGRIVMRDRKVLNLDASRVRREAAAFDAGVRASVGR